MARSPAAAPAFRTVTATEAFLALFSMCLLAVTIINTYNVHLLREDLRHFRDLRADVSNYQQSGSQIRPERKRRNTYINNNNNDDDDDDSERYLGLSSTTSPVLKKYLNSASLKSGDYPYNSNEQLYGGFNRRIKHGRLESYEDRVGRIKVLPSIHFSGDTSRYDINRHDNFLGNGHLKHPRKTFVDWKPNDWVSHGGMDEYFNLNDGILTIKQSGLYFVYAQIYYLDEHDKNGFRVFKNNRTVLQCTITAHSSERRMKGNTCYTAGVEYFSEEDGVELRDLSEGRYSVFEPGMSFFGLIRLGDVKTK